MIFKLIIAVGISKATILLVGISAICLRSSASNVSYFAPADGPDIVINSNAHIPPDKYPTPKRDESVQDTYAESVVIKDPFRWLENPDLPETRKFVEEEMAVTKPYLEKNPFRAELRARYTELYNYPKYYGPIQIGKKFFSYQNTGLQNQDVLFIHDALNDEGEVFLDPNTLSSDGTVALVASAFSDDGKIVAYSTSESGSDWNTLQFKHVEKGDIYEEKLTKIKFSTISWTKDNKGVFYSSYPDHEGDAVGSDNTENKNHKLFYHLLGTDQTADISTVEFIENPNYFVESSISDDGKYLIVSVFEGSNNNLVYVADLDKINYAIKGKLELSSLVTKMEATYSFITNTESQLVFLTNKDANHFKLIVIDAEKPDPSSWRDLVPEDGKNILEWVQAAWDKYLVLCYIEDVKNVLQLRVTATGKLVKKFDLEIGTVHLDSFYSDKKYKDIFFKFESFLTPGIIYHCDLSKQPFDLEIFKEINVPNFNRSKYNSEQVFFNSKDGTRIPMYIVYKKGLNKNGNNFAFMTGYGGYGINELPYFSINRLVVVDDLGGIHALPNIRGGGEYGEQWHKAGSLDKKQNSFDDFQAAAEFLIEENYTSSKLLAIEGGSNGGLLVATCLNQRPDLFGAVIVDVGVLDMLRFDKFTVGHSWIFEYGSPSSSEDFQYLIKYSPLHNINVANKEYPATMLTTSDHDDRVPPLHSLKFIATVQFDAKKNPNQKNPLIIRVETEAGHGDGKPTEKIIAELVDMMSFIVINTGMKFHSS